MDDELRAALGTLEERGLLRSPRRVTGPQGPEMVVDGRRVLCLCSNNYLGLANDPELVAAARDALAEDGLGAGASRLISGSMAAHAALEQSLAAFVQREAAISFSTGWAANLGVISALVGPDDVIFSDALNHASIIDGCRLSRARIVVYPHRDLAALEELLVRERGRAGRALVVTDAVFSMDGEVADVRALRRLCDAHDSWLMVDEAHALGVLGPRGRGLCAEAEVIPEVILGTLGKAFGAAGAFVAGSAALVRYLQNRARSHVFSTAPPPSITAAAHRALALVEAAEDRRARLARHAERLRSGLRAQGWDVRGQGTPIVPILIGDPKRTMRISQALFEAGVFAHGIRPPTVPEGTSRIRVVPMATHDDEHIDRVLAALGELRAELPV